jgi:predicted ATPase/class 3 adenylate cyclase
MQQVTSIEDAVVGTGTLAFLFTDIAGSTRLWETLPVAMADALVRHDGILRYAIESSAGTVVKTTGDGMMAVFPTADDAVGATIEAQRALAATTWGDTGPLRVRMAINAGDAERRGDDYFGPTINRTARLMAAGYGGQVLLSAAAAALAAEDLPSDTTLRDLGEYRLRDLGRPERVYQLVHPDLQAAFPPLRALDNVAARLPAPTSALVGRRVELEAVERLLADAAVRLLTLTGPGGTGKTSLAIRAAGDSSDRFRDGVVFVDLATTRDAEGLLIAMGRAVGVGETPDRPIRDELTDRLRTREALLLLDNFEQVTASASVATELLDACPDIKLLVTSREPLHVRVEQVYPVPPLGLPPATRGRVSADEVEGIESIELFVERARAVRPDFAVTDDNAAAVGEICRRLDGLPLAIELAAARLQLFSPESLRDRLSQGLDLLRSTTRDLPERQQTLRGTIGWSYELLEPTEQRLFERLAAFTGADIRAIEAVSSATDADGAAQGDTAAAAAAATPVPDVVGALGSLIEKSLCRQVESAGGEPRVVMLETIREFAIEQLDRRPEAAAVRRAHAVYYADVAASLRGELFGAERETAMASMVAESGNLHASWRHWVDDSDLGRLGQLVQGLLALNEARAWYRDTVELITDLLGVLERTTTTPQLVDKEIGLRVSLARAMMATQGFTPEVADAYASALKLFEAGAGSPRQQFSVVRGLASVYLLRAEFEKCTELGERILEVAAAERDPSMAIDGHLVVGSTVAFLGRPKEGLEQLETGIRLFDPATAGPLGFRFGNDPRVSCLTTSGFIHWMLGFSDTAVERMDAAIALSDRLAHPYTAAYARFHSGLLHLWRREPELVLDRAIRLHEIADEYDFRLWTAVGSVLMGAAEASLGRTETGLAHVTEGVSAYQEMIAPPVFLPMLFYVAAGANALAGRMDKALKLVTAAIETIGGPEAERLTIPELTLARGDLLAATGATSEAVEAWGRSRDGARAFEVRMVELRALTRLVVAAQGTQREPLIQELRSVYDTFTEGLETADLREAAAVLEDGTAAEQ